MCRLLWVAKVVAAVEYLGRWWERWSDGFGGATGARCARCNTGQDQRAGNDRDD